jgi:predicted DNA-binding transcriptional regulator YafY
LQALAQELGCSKPTVKRAIRELRELLGAPLDYDRERDGYYYARDEAAPFQLPGLWFSPDELYALLTTYRLLGQIQGGLLEEYIAPLRERVEALLKDDRAGHAQIDRRVRILPLASRQTDLQHFRHVANALVARRRMRILYHGRARDETTERVVSAQRLVYYRDNWYLDAWCHMREGLRSFSVDRAHPVETLEETALELDDAALDAYYASAYGIFAGEATNTAHLLFSPSAARWVADEQWHPDQRSEVREDGGYELWIPYADQTELIMDILKYGPELEVLGPAELRSEVAERLTATLDRYT